MSWMHSWGIEQYAGGDVCSIKHLICFCALRAGSPYCSPGRWSVGLWYCPRAHNVPCSELHNKPFVKCSVAGRPYRGKPSDMWALGVVLFTMLYGQFPFYDSIPQELFRKIKAAEYSIPEWVLHTRTHAPYLLFHWSQNHRAFFKISIPAQAKQSMRNILTKHYNKNTITSALSWSYISCQF